MDFDDSSYYIDNIDDCVNDFVQDLLIKDDLTNMASEAEEEHPGEIAREEKRQKVQDKPRPETNGGRGWTRRKTRKDHPHEQQARFKPLHLISIRKNLFHS